MSVPSNAGPKYYKKRARNELAIRTLFLGASEDTDSMGLQLEAVWCQGGSVLSHVCRTPAPCGVFPREAASASRRSWRALAEATVGTPSGCPGRQMGNKKKVVWRWKPECLAWPGWWAVTRHL